MMSSNDEQTNQQNLNQNAIPTAQAILAELQKQLNNIYAELDVSRQKIKNLADEGRSLGENHQAWDGKTDEAEAFLKNLNQLEQKIYQTLDLKRLKAEGLVKAVKF